jgi:hypothetical protein
MSADWVSRTSSIQQCLEAQRKAVDADPTRLQKDRMYWLEDELSAEAILQESAIFQFKGRCPAFKFPE